MVVTQKPTKKPVPGLVGHKKTKKTSITDTSPAPMPAMARFADAGFRVSAPLRGLVEEAGLGSGSWSGVEGSGCWDSESAAPGGGLLVLDVVMGTAAWCWLGWGVAWLWMLSEGLVWFFGRIMMVSMSMGLALALAEDDRIKAPSRLRWLTALSCS